MDSGAYASSAAAIGLLPEAIGLAETFVRDFKMGLWAGFPRKHTTAVCRMLVKKLDALLCTSEMHHRANKSRSNIMRIYAYLMASPEGPED